MAIILYGARKWKILNCFSLPKQWSQFSGVMEMHLKIKHVLQQQDAPLPNYIYSSNFRKQYLLSIWAVKAMILALLKQEFGTFNCIVLYYRMPGLSQTCFSAPDRNRTESVRECDLMTLFSEWVSASTQAWKRKECFNVVCTVTGLSKEIQVGDNVQLH